jgi:hypothetical protein
MLYLATEFAAPTALGSGPELLAYFSGGPMSSRNQYSNLPVEHREEDLEELEPHQQTIERVAGVYYGACDRMARVIRTIKNQLSSAEDG